MEFTDIILSIIIPFHNSSHKCHRLMANLLNINDLSIEVILVDDGSTDGTYAQLQAFVNEVTCKVYLIKHENKGPGGARNSGLNLSKGKYVWFVDSDDGFEKEAIDLLKTVAKQDYDFIDFNILNSKGVVSSMDFSKGAYHVDDGIRSALLLKFGRITSKIIKKELIVNNQVFYPEKCIYEDNSLLFLYPFLVEKFYKADKIGYIHYEDFESVTRTKGNSLKFYDRLATAIYGFERSKKYIIKRDECLILEEKFTRIFLINTVNALVSRFPSQGWFMSIRVMQYYREKAQYFGINSSPFVLLIGSNWYRSVFLLMWMLSYFMPKQEEYFEQIHLMAWGEKIKFIS